MISVELLERIYEKLMVSADQPTEGTNGTEYDSSQYLKIVNAFDMPPWRWNEENKTFEKYVLRISLLLRTGLMDTGRLKERHWLLPRLRRRGI